MRISLLVISLLISAVVFAQERKEADKLFDQGNYISALPLYKEVYEEDPEDVELNYHIGVCYLNTNIDKSKAVPYLEKILNNKEANPNTTYLLARAYQFAYEFDKAIALYTTFRKLNEGNEDNIRSIDTQIEYCQNAKEYMKFPLNVDVKNLGENVNSPYPDYYPFVPVNESFLMFNSKRHTGTELPDGTFTSDVLFSTVVDGDFTDAELLKNNINSFEGNEEVVGLKADGTMAVIYKEDFKGGGDLYVTTIENGKFSDPKKLNKKINSKYTEIAASIADDGKSIYFASDMPDGYGGTDLYVSRILPNGEWGPAQNLGPTVNTEFDEDFPNISPDGKTLYFSSKGHTSMGGYDIFRVKWDMDKLKFLGVENMRFPINTPEDDMNFIISQNGRYGYMSSLRGDGYGDIDIYRITFNEIDPRFTVITGRVKDERGQPVDSEQVYLAVIDRETDEVYGDYKPNPTSNRFVMILPPGKYEISLAVSGYDFYTEDIEIKGKSSYKSEIQKDIVLKTVD